MTDSQPKFDQGGYLVCHNRKFMFVVIAKNASTSLKRLVYLLDHPNEPGNICNEEIHNYFGFIQNGRDRLSIKGGQAEKYKHYIKFAVYRDPVERFLSVYFDKAATGRSANKIKRKYFEKSGVIGTDLDTFITFAEKELDKPDTNDQDEHLRRQSDFYRPGDVDYIVPIQKLGNFLKQTCGLDNLGHSNATDNMSKGEIKEGQLDRIKKLYLEDYKYLDSVNIYHD